MGAEEHRGSPHARQGLFTTVATQSECKLESRVCGRQQGQLYVQVPSDKGTRGGGVGEELTMLLSKTSRERGSEQGDGAGRGNERLSA